MKFTDIQRLTESAHYRVNQAWQDLEGTLNRYFDKELTPLNIDPDFQRGHVWTKKQQIAYVEFKLRGGEGSDIIYFNCPGWMDDFRGPFELVDGKQRLQAARRFINNKIPAFGKYRKEYEGRIPSYCDFIFAINNLKTRKEVLQWYLEMNSGGTPHTKKELEKVKLMLEEE